jgi:hypothetical protein
MSKFYPHIYNREEEIESVLIQGKCFKDYLFYDFKKNLTQLNEFYPRRVHCDLIAISKDYSHWSIVEVELAKHDLANHIWPQIIRLKEVSSLLTIKERESILNQLNLDSCVVDRLKHDEPRLFLIFDKSKINLSSILTFMGPIGTTMFINPFKNDFNEFIYNEEIHHENCIKNKESVVFPYGNRLHIVNPSILGIDLSTNSRFRILDTNDNHVEAVIWNEFVKIPENTISTEMKITNLDGTFKLIKNGI